MKTNTERIKELKEEIINCSTEKVLKHNSNKWKPLTCLLCGKNFTSRGIDRHLKLIHNIIRFDFGDIRNAELQAREECQKEFKEKIEKLKHWIDNENGSGKYFMSLGIDMLNEKIKQIFGEQQVFPKVFEGRYFTYSVKDEIDVLNIKRGDIELDFSEGTLLLNEVEIEALKQALAFRDDLLREKKK